MSEKKTMHSRDMASGTFGAEVRFTCELPRERFADIMSNLLYSVAKGIDTTPHAMLGHAKLFAEVDRGFLKQSVVDPRLGVETIDEMKVDIVTRGRLKLMAVAVGTDDASVERIVDTELDRLSGLMRCEVIGHDHEGHHH